MENEPTINDVLQAIQIFAENVDRRFESVDQRFESMDKRMDSLEFEMKRGFASLMAEEIGFT